MSTIFDRETTLKALRDAAWVARHGTREERSGKFLPPPGWKGVLVTAADGTSSPQAKSERKRKRA